MPHLFDLVDRFIGDVLDGNIYTNGQSYQESLFRQADGTFTQAPDGAYSGIPSTDPRLLNFPEQDFHPHGAKAGPDVTRHVIHTSDARKLHDNKDVYTDIDGRIPQQKRNELYHPATPALTIQQQVERMRGNNPPPPDGTRGHTDGVVDRANPFTNSSGQTPDIRRTQIYNPATPPESVDQAANRIRDIPPTPNFVNTESGETPPAQRARIYESSDRGRNSSQVPASVRNLVDFHQNKENEFVRGETQSGDTTPLFSKKEGAGPESFSRRDEFYSNRPELNSNIGGAAPLPSGVAVSNPTAGDLKTAQGEPPAPPLTFRNDSDKPSRADIAGLQGQLRKDIGEGYRGGNLYDDAPPPASQNPVASQGGQFGSQFPGPTKYFDIFAVARWVRNVSTELGLVARANNNNLIEGKDKVDRSPRAIEKGITLLATQLLLTSFNPSDPENSGIANQIGPGVIGSVTAGSVPFLRLTPVVAPVASAFIGYKDATNQLASLEDTTDIPSTRLRRMRDGTYVKPLDGNQVAQFRFPDAGFLGDTTTVGSPGRTRLQSIQDGPGGVVDLESQTDGGVATEAVRQLGIHTNLYSSDSPYATEGSFGPKNYDNAILPQKKLEEKTDGSWGDVKLAAMFTPTKFPGGSISSQEQGLNWVAKSILPPTDLGVDANELLDTPSNPDNLAVRIHPNEGTVLPGVVTSTTEAGAQILKDGTDDQLYMPFTFQDLRDDPPQFLYFRAFLKEGLSETFTPDWSLERYYGRVDQIPVYMGTVRNLNFAFDLVAWTPDDLPLMYRKLQKLQSLAFPTYDGRGFLQAGPIIRVRIGDLFKAENNMGLPGYITSLDFSFDDGIWNLKKDFKVPRKVSISLGYTVLHDGNPGIYPFETWALDADGNVTQEQGGRTFGTLAVQNNQNGTTSLASFKGNVRGVYKSADVELGVEDSEDSI